MWHSPRCLIVCHKLWTLLLLLELSTSVMGIGMLQLQLRYIRWALICLGGSCLCECKFEKNKIKFMYLQFCNPLEPDPLAHGANYEQLLCPHGQQVRPFPLQQLCPPLALSFTSSALQFTECQMQWQFAVACGAHVQQMPQGMHLQQCIPLCNAEFRVATALVSAVGSYTL